MPKSQLNFIDPDAVIDAFAEAVSMTAAQRGSEFAEADCGRGLALTVYDAAMASNDTAAQGAAAIKLGQTQSRHEGIIRAMKACGDGDPTAPMTIAGMIGEGHGLGAAVEQSGILFGENRPARAEAVVDARTLGLGYRQGARATLGAPGPRLYSDTIDTRPSTRDDVLDAFTRQGGARPWETDQVTYLKETVTTDAAAERAPGGSIAESEISLAEAQEPIRSVGHKVQVNDETLADGGPRLRRYIDERLPRMTRARINRQLVAGAGSGANLTGVAHAASHAANTQTVNYAAATFAALVLPAISDAQEAIFNNGEAVASHVIINASVWAGIKKLQVKGGETSANSFDTGQFVLGNPADADIARSLWGLTVILVPSTVLPDGATDADVVAVVGDFDNFAEFYLRQDARVETGWVANNHAYPVVTHDHYI